MATTETPAFAKASAGKQNLISRPPVVVILGHVDSGKTSILDFIRKTQVAEKESGGITQHIGAYQLERDGKKITFIDTPGHEAFSQMRSRGAKVADIAILVVDGCQGVQPQTKEAILHIKKSGIPMIVAINKIDRPEANPEKIKRELLKEDVLVEGLGGKIPSVGVSSKTGQGISDLLELILLVSEMENLKASLQKPAEGVIIEAYLDSLRGPTATLILNQGKLYPGQVIGTYSTFGKIKNLEDFQGVSIPEALPSQPVIVLGFESPPRVGEEFKVFPDIEQARNYLQLIKKELPPEATEIGPDQKVLNLILKTDVLGSIEAIEEVLKSLPKEKPSTRAKPRTRAELGSGLSRTELRSSSGLGAGLVPHRNEVSGAGVILRILKSEAGQISESDVKFAAAHSVAGHPALILGFRVKINPMVQRLAEGEKIKILTFDVIYDLVEGVRKFMEKIAEPERVRKDLGKVKISAIFLAEKNRLILGGKVIEGEVKKGALIEVFRAEELIGTGKLINLQRDKKDAEKVIKGQDCGVLFEGDLKIEEGDILVIYEITHSAS